MLPMKPAVRGIVCSLSDGSKLRMRCESQADSSVVIQASFALMVIAVWPSA